MPWTAILNFLAKLSTAFISLSFARKGGKDSERAKQSKKEKEHAEKNAGIAADDFVDDPGSKL